MSVHQRAPRIKPPDSSSAPPPIPGITVELPTPVSPAFGSSISTYVPPTHRSGSRSRSKSPSSKHRRSSSFSGPWLPDARPVAIMIAFVVCLSLYLFMSADPVAAKKGNIASYHGAQEHYRRQACPDYKDYSARRHPPFSEGDYPVPYQRPAEKCRLFRSEAVEKRIEEITEKMADPSLARLFENCFPNTLDTTVRWHKDGEKTEDLQSFIVTGDINAQWLRDSTNQLAQYQSLAKEDPAIAKLLKGAINTQADYILESPYCNAFQPPPASNLPPTSNGQADTVHPIYDPDVVFECKYEIDSLASFLSLANQYYTNTGDSSFVTSKWLEAVNVVLSVLEEQSVGTFTASGEPADMVYTFKRETNTGTETLNLNGLGNPLASNTSLIRSAFRPSDDACIMQYFIPGNAFMSVELLRTASMLSKLSKKHSKLATTLHDRGSSIRAGILTHGITTHAAFGRVYAYEIDGFGSHIMMDDANLPSLLSLPLIGFVPATDEVYQNTRRMVLSRTGNPYFLTGSRFKGIGGPHIGITHAWPLSLLVQAMTTDDDDEIAQNLATVLKVSADLGLIHESVNVEKTKDYTRSWFAWANSVYAQTILDLAERKPHLIFGPRKKGARKPVETEDEVEDDEDV